MNFLEVLIDIKKKYDAGEFEVKHNVNHNTRSNNKNLISRPQHKTTFYERNYLFKGITWWNKMPQELKLLEFKLFKEKIKTIATSKVPYNLKELENIF